MGRRFVQMRDALSSEPFGVHRGTGRGFRFAVDRFAQTGDWRSSARTDRVGNGAAMRIAPIGVALRDLDDGSFRTAIAEVSILTHREIRSIAAALAVAKTAAELSHSPSYPPDDDPLRRLLESIEDSVRRLEAAVASMYEDLFVETAAENGFSEALASSPNSGDEAEASMTSSRRSQSGRALGWANLASRPTVMRWRARSPRS